MKILTIIYIIILFILPNLIFSQITSRSVRVIGMVTDTNQYPLPYSTVEFLNNNEIIKYGAICDSLGFFNLDSVKNGKYILKISCIGYKTTKQNLIIDTSNTKQLINPISLKIDVKQLETIEINANKTGYFSYVDKSVFYPDSSVLKVSKNAIDVIKRVPEIKVNKKDNTIKVLGNKNVMLLVNGVYNNRALNAITPDEIEKIEVITHPSAKYRSDIASVVNVVLKDKRKQGIDIYSDLSLCLHQKNHMTFTQISYNYKKLRLFINYNAFFSKIINRDTTKGIEDESKYLKFSINDPRFDYNNQEFQYGFDYAPNKTFLINFTGDLKYREMIDKYLGKTIYTQDSLPNNEILHKNNTLDNNIQQNYSLYLKKEFNKKNIISLITNLYFLTNTNNSNIENKHLNTALSNINKNTIFSDMQQSSINSKIDYTYKINKQLKIESGYQLYVRNIKININDNKQISILKYIDYRNSFYANSVLNIKNNGFQAGLRIENLHISLYDTVNNSYTKTLPFISLNHKFKHNNSIKISYNQRLNYPKYYQLNPYTYYSADSININSGNPYLTPEISHNINTNFSFNKKNFFSSIYLEYRNINNIIVESLQTSNGKIISKFNNLGKAEKYISNFNISITLFDLIDFEPDISIEYNTFKDRSEYNGFSYYTEIALYMSLFWDIDLDVNIILQEKRINYNGYEITNAMIDEISLSKYIFNNYFVIGFSVWEPFLKSIDNEKKWTRTYTESVYYEQINNTCYMFNLTFMLNKGRKAKEIKNKLLMEDNYKAR